jgi:hypothetical protein
MFLANSFSVLLLTRVDCDGLARFLTLDAEVSGEVWKVPGIDFLQQGRVLYTAKTGRLEVKPGIRRNCEEFASSKNLNRHVTIPRKWTS